MNCNTIHCNCQLVCIKIVVVKLYVKQTIKYFKTIVKVNSTAILSLSIKLIISEPYMLWHSKNLIISELPYTVNVKLQL